MIQKIGIVGLGALGIMYAELFQDALGKGHVYVIADRDRIQRYQKDGVYANGERCDFLYMDAGEAEEMDLLIFATKYHGLADAAETRQKRAGRIRLSCRYSTGLPRKKCWSRSCIRRICCTVPYRVWMPPVPETN